jgi:hypothetical protein
MTWRGLRLGFERVASCVLGPGMLTQRSRPPAFDKPSQSADNGLDLGKQRRLRSKDAASWEGADLLGHLDSVAEA